MDTGKIIRRIRADKGIRQGKMAEELGITQNYLSLLENNKHTPSLALLQKIAKIYEVEITL